MPRGKGVLQEMFGEGFVEGSVEHKVVRLRLLAGIQLLPCLLSQVDGEDMYAEILRERRQAVHLGEHPIHLPRLPQPADKLGVNHAQMLVHPFPVGVEM